MKKYTITIEKDENGMFVWEVEWLPACYTQAKTVPELLDRLVEVTDWSLQLLNNIDTDKKFNFSLHVDYATA